MRWLFCFFDVLNFLWFSTFFNLLVINVGQHFFLISSTLFVASIVLFQSSRSYLTGSFLCFPNSNELSTVSSLPAALRKAIVHVALEDGTFF